MRYRDSCSHDKFRLRLYWQAQQGKCDGPAVYTVENNDEGRERDASTESERQRLPYSTLDRRDDLQRTRPLNVVDDTSEDGNTVMDNSRPSSPDAPPQDLWSSILDSVSTSRSTPAKHALVLGQPSSGKSTLVSALLQKPSSDADSEDRRTDFALGYDWANVRDDADEGECSRIRSRFGVMELHDVF